MEQLSELISYEVNTGDVVTFGMILTEMLFNALQHGDYRGVENELRIYLFREEEGALGIKVTNPVAAQKNIESSSFGSELISSLAESLGGSFYFIKERNNLS